MQEFTKEHFKQMDKERFYLWVHMFREQLIGSAIFTKCDKFGSKLVSWAQKVHDKSKDEFIPSHTGSIIEKDGELYLFDMKPPKASIQHLTRYLLSTKDDYILVLRDFPLDTFMFSQNLLYHVGEFYAYLSALRSVFTKRKTKFVRHCSEMHLTELQKQGLYKDVNPEITPNELLNLFRKDKITELNNFIESEN
jgi:hypothetical protein